MYFDGQTWDFKTSLYRNEDTIRQLFKEGRKADNVIFIIADNNQKSMVKNAVEREVGRMKKLGTWRELPDVYCLIDNELVLIWKK